MSGNHTAVDSQPAEVGRYGNANKEDIEYIMLDMNEMSIKHKILEISYKLYNENNAKRQTMT